MLSPTPHPSDQAAPIGRTRATLRPRDSRTATGRPNCPAAPPMPNRNKFTGSQREDIWLMELRKVPSLRRLAKRGLEGRKKFFQLPCPALERSPRNLCIGGLSAEFASRSSALRNCWRSDFVPANTCFSELESSNLNSLLPIASGFARTREGSSLCRVPATLTKEQRETARKQRASCCFFSARRNRRNPGFPPRTRGRLLLFFWQNSQNRESARAVVYDAAPPSGRAPCSSSAWASATRSLAISPISPRVSR